MGKTIGPNDIGMGTMKLSNNITEVIVPCTFSNIVFKSNNVTVFGLKADSMPSTMDIQAMGPGRALLSIMADCTYQSPQTGQVITQRKLKAIPISVVSSGEDFLVTFE